MKNDITIRDLVPDEKILPEDFHSGLVDWYRGILDKKISEFNVNDCCRACRQRIQLEYIIPIALIHLQKNPSAGELYDGELIAAINNIPKEYWGKNKDDTKKLEKILNSIKCDDLEDLEEEEQKDIKSCINDLLNKIQTEID